MAKPPDEKKPQQPKPTPIPHAPDHVAAGAADLRSRAKACRIAAVNVGACRRLEAAADLLDPEVDEVAADLATAPQSAPEGHKGAGAGKKGGKPRRAVSGAVSEVREATPAPAEVDDDLDDELDDEEA